MIRFRDVEPAKAGPLAPAPAATPAEEPTAQASVAAAPAKRARARKTQGPR